MSSNYYELALALVRAGISVLPIKPAEGDADKRPALSSWKVYQSRLPEERELASWFRGYACRGIAAIGGPVSGGLECIDFDEPGLFEEWAVEVDKLAPDLLDRCVIVKTPKVGIHVWYRCSAVEGSQLLAERPPSADELRDNPKKDFVKRIETRGTGGYALVPGSARECHRFCLPYVYHTERGLGDLTRVQEIAVGERDILFRLARSYSLLEDEAPVGEHPRLSQKGSGGLSIGDDYERKASWQDILEPHGWHVDSGTWESGHLCRAGKKNGTSATVGYCRGKDGEPLLYVFSTDAGMPTGCYGKFRAYARLNHGGDHKAAATTLGYRGYGMQKSSPTANSKQATARPTTSVEPQQSPQQNEGDNASLKVNSIKGRKVRPVKYLVEGKIPLGKVTMIAGVGGMGKSTLTRHLIACLTTGRPAFGLEYDAPPPCDVLLVSVEDSPEDTIVPHLIAEQADLGRVLMVEGVRRMEEQGEKDYLFDLRDLDLIRKYLRANPQVRLLIIDPIMSFIGRAGLNENRSSEVRMLLDPLLAMADEMGIAIVLIAHLNKADKVAAVNRIVGSTAFRDTCRAVYFVGRDPDDDAKRVMALAKENVPGIDTRSIAFTREPLPADRLAEVLAREEFSELDAEDLARIEKQLAYVRPLGISTCDADGIVGANPSSNGATPRANKRVEPCMEWILKFLAEFAYPSDEVKAACTDEKQGGFSPSTFDEAKAKLGRNGNGKVWNTNRYPISERSEWWMGLGDPKNWIKRPNVRNSETPKHQANDDIPD